MLTDDTRRTCIEALEHYDDWVRDLIGMAYYHDSPDNGAGELKKIANALAELRNQAGGEWTPLPDGEYEMQGYSTKYILRVCYDGRDLEAWPVGHNPNYPTDEIGLGEFRLCIATRDGGGDK